MRTTRSLRAGALAAGVLITVVGIPCGSAGAARATGLSGPGSPALTVDAASCRRLGQQLRAGQLTDATAQWVSAGPLPRTPLMPPAPPVQLPAHCLVRAALEPRTGVDGRHYQIGFELRLPQRWSGRFLYQGGGGLDGSVQPAVGLLAAQGRPALARGYAVVSTDSGHQGLDASFGFDQQARLNYAYAAIGKVTRAAKRIIADYYGRGPSHSYFVGCSNGGREAMMAAQRFPDQFNGIVAGDPGFHLSAAAVGEMWDDVQLARIAPRDAQGRAILSRAFSARQLRRVAQAVLRQCDALDGLADGMINDVQGCHFNPAVLECRPGGHDAADQPACLSRQQLAALEAIFGGARNSMGQRLSPPWPFDAGIGAPGWRAWKLGTSPSAVPNAINATLGLNAMQDYFLTPPRPQLTPGQFDFDHDPQRVAQTAAINDATSTFMTSFKARQGRLLIYQGLSDPVFSADDIMDWYRQLTHDSAAAQGWARLFLVPGMNHCGGGPATDDFDALSAIQAWTERGIAPQRLLARSRTLSVTRPLCPFPQYAHYRGGNPRDAASFECR
jgi:Tannase and feruloyl esterase